MIVICGAMHHIAQLTWIWPSYGIVQFSPVKVKIIRFIFFIFEQPLIIARTIDSSCSWVHCIKHLCQVNQLFYRPMHNFLRMQDMLVSSTIFVALSWISFKQLLVLSMQKLLLQALTKNTDTGMSFHDPKFPTMNGQPKELFFSGNANALVEHTKRVLVIEDNEGVHLKVHSPFYLQLLVFSYCFGLFSFLFMLPSLVNSMWSWFNMIIYQLFLPIDIQIYRPQDMHKKVHQRQLKKKIWEIDHHNPNRNQLAKF